MPEAASWTPLALALLGVWALGFAAVAGAWAARALKVRALLRESAAVHRGIAASRRAASRSARRRRSLEPALVGIVAARAAAAARHRRAPLASAARRRARARARALAPPRQPDGRRAHARRGRVLVSPARLVDRRAARRGARARVRRGRRARGPRRPHLCRGNTQRLRALRRVDAQVRRGNQRRRSETARRRNSEEPSHERATDSEEDPVGNVCAWHVARADHFRRGGAGRRRAASDRPHQSGLSGRGSRGRPRRRGAARVHDRRQRRDEGHRRRRFLVAGVRGAGRRGTAEVALPPDERRVRRNRVHADRERGSGREAGHADRASLPARGREPARQRRE